MLTFSINPTIERISKAGAAVVVDKPINRLDHFEQMGISEGFIKTVQGKQQDQKLNIGAYGNGVIKNTKLSVGSREVGIDPVEEVMEGSGGVADTVLRTDDFANDEKWLERLDFDVEAFITTFVLVYNQIRSESGESLVHIIRLALKGEKKMITRLAKLTNEYLYFDDLVNLLNDNIPLPDKLDPSKRKRYGRKHKPVLSEEEIAIQHEEMAITNIERSELIRSKVKLEMLDRVLNYLENNDFKSMLHTLLDNEQLEYAVGIKNEKVFSRR